MRPPGLSNSDNRRPRTGSSRSDALLTERLELCVCQLDPRRGQVLLQVLERQRPWDRQDRRGPPEEPRELDPRTPPPAAPHAPPASRPGATPPAPRPAHATAHRSTALAIPSRSPPR